MRTTKENAKIDELARGLLETRGIDRPTFAEYADAAGLVSEVVEKRGTDITLAEFLGSAAIGDSTPDATLTKVLAKHASDGRFVADLSLSEEELLRSAIEAEQRRDAEILAEDADRRRHATVAAEHPHGTTTLYGHAYCSRCGYDLVDHGCVCGKR